LVKTVVKSVRLPDSLFHLVMCANPGKNFSQIINNLLNKEYGFSSPCKPEETTSCKPGGDNFHKEVDEIIKRMEVK
jgi:hypothetical protein